MYSKADATVVTIDHPNIRAHTSNRVVEQPFIKSGRSQQYFFSVRKEEERHQRNDTCRGFTGMCACSMASTSSFWLLEDQVPATFADKEPIYDGKLAGMASSFLLIVLFNLDQKEVLQRGARGCVSQVWHMKCLVGQGNVVGLTRA